MVISFYQEGRTLLFIFGNMKRQKKKRIEKERGLKLIF